MCVKLKCMYNYTFIHEHTNAVEIHRQSKVTRSPTMCRMNTCKPSVSKGRSCNTLVQKLSPALHMVPLCGYFGSQVEANNMYTSAAQTVTHGTPHVDPNKKNLNETCIFFQLGNLHTYISDEYWNTKWTNPALKKQSFRKMVGMDLTRRMGLLWRLPGMVSGKHEEHQSFFMFFYHSKRVPAKIPQEFHVVRELWQLLRWTIASQPLGATHSGQPLFVRPVGPTAIQRLLWTG